MSDDGALKEAVAAAIAADEDAAQKVRDGKVAAVGALVGQVMSYPRPRRCRACCRRSRSPRASPWLPKIHSLVADEPPSGLLRRRPFRSPHPGVSAAGMVGGRSQPAAGRGDAWRTTACSSSTSCRSSGATRSRRSASRSRKGRVTIVRAPRGTAVPGPRSLVAAMNPCPCGHLGDPRRACRCTPPPSSATGRESRDRCSTASTSTSRCPRSPRRELRPPAAERSADVAARVAAARELQSRRFGALHPHPYNAAMEPEALRRVCLLDAAGLSLLDRAFERLGLARALARILKVARTIADLAGSEAIRTAHLAEAIQYRTLDRRVDR